MSQQTQRRSPSLRSNSPTLSTIHRFSPIPMELYRQPVESECDSRPALRASAMSDRVDTFMKKKLHLFKQQLAETIGVTLTEENEKELEGKIKEGLPQMQEENQQKKLREERRKQFETERKRCWEEWKLRERKSQEEWESQEWKSQEERKSQEE